MPMTRDFFATTPKGLEPLLVRELDGLGAESVKEARAGVEFRGTLETAYRACLWSRLANRILMPLDRFAAATPEVLYDGVQRTDWSRHFGPDATLAVDFSSRRSAITHTLFGAQKVKDAIADQFLEHCGRRPSVRLERPDIRVKVHLDADQAVISLDLSGDSLHRRGYRTEAGPAPLKENLAAAVLIRAGWPDMAARGGSLIDPMCGSGTLLIEGALLAADIAPGSLREYFGFLAWKGHDLELWRKLLIEARERGAAGLARLPPILGYDRDRSAIHLALNNIDRAGLRGRIHVERKAAADARPKGAVGLVVVNPPYGERLGDIESLIPVYHEFGEALKQHFQGWKAALLTGNFELAFQIGIRAGHYYTLYNGALECRLFLFDIAPERFFIPRSGAPETEGQKKLRQIMQQAGRGAVPAEQAEMFANRLRKNLRNLGTWARKSGVSCYRLYDADLPEFAVAVDIYQGEKLWVHVQEYEAPASVDPAKAQSRLAGAVAMIPEVLQVPREQIFLKVRRRQKGDAQYFKQDQTAHFHMVEEGGWRFWVNFEDYLDTGLFLDHRITRGLIQQAARDRHFLNLFAYTGTATVYAAGGGAASTTTVDMSRTYLDWAGRNLALNGFGERHHLRIQANCLDWLDQAVNRGRRYGLIFLDPPTFSNSKRMAGSFDIQRDQGSLLKKVISLLEPGGMLIFSTNCRRFKLDETELAGCAMEDISRLTLPKDFERNPKIHACWRILAPSRQR
ncbi:MULTISPECIES: bifunctional 23S rRNA (guanine(2069)-N(7))-methyltransferase RlmK/23S rRNA (guanine(2445)-N(2))-methyltransferase RlmL [Methylococcus]|uniref:Ribosomal RNA large subunit methyltransferase K/L n=1 Tax=Methylococcus capsulatus TaxID=414 RepID=A0ABZ2F0V9_METCP|nr:MULTISPECIES: bifunctional 23S rRNA (guanine(2069)-N(7))-methyltransferase RlmK/23S rRNA (guanine(2445)-N(2))-methyltransferase RlmL [Methylococcus]MDF9391388.1 bifunctional 23S rRNA (guanine(2069)-N(7))-methyltransferase RlmK/23S rRNA (guanine(2445)-N(2))-methyltransferase RlmL [Methylococcus capsulatus]